jgi:hypothetical protein
MGTSQSKKKKDEDDFDILNEDFSDLEGLESEDDNAEIGEKELDGVLLVHAHGSLDENESIMRLTDPQMIVMTFCRVGESLLCSSLNEEREKEFFSTKFASGTPLLLQDVTQFEMDQRTCRYKYPENSACVKSIRQRVGSVKGTKFTFPMIFGGSVVAHHNKWEGLFYCDKNGCRDVTTILEVQLSPSKYVYEATNHTHVKVIEHERSLHLFNMFDVENNQQIQLMLNDYINILFENLHSNYIQTSRLITAELIDTIIQLFILPENVGEFRTYLDKMISLDEDGLDKAFYVFGDTDVYADRVEKIGLAKQRIAFLRSLNVFPNQTSNKVRLTLDVDKKFVFLSCMLFTGDIVENLQRIYDKIVNIEERSTHGMLFSLKKRDNPSASEQQNTKDSKLYFMDSSQNNVFRVHVLFLSILRMIQNLNNKLECDGFAELSESDQRIKFASILVYGSSSNHQWVMSKYKETDFSKIIPTLRSKLMDNDPSKELLVSLPVCRVIPGSPPPSSFEHSPHGSESEGDVNDTGGGKKKQNNKKTKQQTTKKQNNKKQNNKTTKKQNNKTTKQQNNKTTKQQKNKKTKKQKKYKGK